MQPNLRLEGASSGNLVEVAGSNQVKVIPEIDATNNDANIGGTRLFYENDQGLANYGGMVPYLRAVRSSDEYRKRVELDVLLDEEVFSTVTQNLTKHSMTSATYVPAWTLSGFNTNPKDLQDVLHSRHRDIVIGCGSLIDFQQLDYNAGRYRNRVGLRAQQRGISIRMVRWYLCAVHCRWRVPDYAQQQQHGYQRLRSVR